MQFKISILIIILFGHLRYLQATPSGRNDWIDTLVKTKMEVLSERSETPQIMNNWMLAKENEDALPISVNIEGAQQLVLTVKKANLWDNVWDYSVWVNPVLTTRSGEKVWLDTLPYSFAIARDGSSPMINQNENGGTISVNGKKYLHGISCYADGIIVYDLPDNKFVRFDTEIGIDDFSQHASFESRALFNISNVHSQKYADELRQLYPDQIGLYFSRIMKQNKSLADLLMTADAGIERRSVEDVTALLKIDTEKYEQRIEEIAKLSDLADQLRGYLNLYQEVTGLLDSQMKAEKVFSFAFLTDVHLMPDNSRGSYKGFDEALNHVKNQDIDFIIFGGDNMAEDNAAEEKAEWLMTTFKTMADRPGIRYYPVVGNHDVTYLNDEKSDPYSVNVFERVFGVSQYYSFNHKGVHFVLLNSNQSDDYEIKEEQLNWLKADLLQTGTSTPVVIVTHVPIQSLYNPALLGKITGVDIISNYKAVWDIVHSYNIQLVLQGHQHIFEELFVKNTQFITGGAVCGAWWHPGNTFAETHRGYLMVTLKKNGQFEWEYVVF